MFWSRYIWWSFYKMHIQTIDFLLQKKSRTRLTLYKQPRKVSRLKMPGVLSNMLLYNSLFWSRDTRKNVRASGKNDVWRKLAFPLSLDNL